MLAHTLSCRRDALLPPKAPGRRRAEAVVLQAAAILLRWIPILGQ